jgi:hypothetical protein
VNLAACVALPHTPENGVWYRSILLNHLKTALSSHHTRLAASRFNAGSHFTPADRFPSLYFSDDPLVAQFEVGALLGSPFPGQHIRTRVARLLSSTSASSCTMSSTSRMPPRRLLCTPPPRN